MEEGSVAVLVDAKEEYTKQLISILKACIYQGIKSIYMDAKDICHQDNSPDNVLMVFQDLLSRIPKWSQDIINKEYERITSVSKCDYIDDLLKVVYVSHIKVLTIVHSAQKNKKISLKVPSGSHFIHLCYIECAREFWKDPYFFSDRVSKYEHQKNMRDSETMIAECIMETIRKQLPVRHILKEFLNEPDEEIEENEEEDIKEPLKKKYLKKLETVVKKELKTTNTTNGAIDIDLIRKVIREEMGLRPTTDTIKKELVDTVIEKIVEQSQDGGADIKDVGEVVIKDNIKDDSVIIEEDVSVKEDIKKDIKDISVIPNAEENANINTKNKTSGGSLEKLLDDNFRDDIISDDEEKINDTTSIITNVIHDTTINNDISIDSSANIGDAGYEEDDIEIDNDNKSTTSESKLVINNIDEVNLNLDELDNDLGVEINLDELQNVDISKPKEVEKDKNTKYIFFKDVA